jgi:hypothetical protein
MNSASKENQTIPQRRKNFNVRSLLVTVILVTIVLYVSYKVISFIYVFTHPNLVRYPFYCESLSPSMSKEQIKTVLDEEGLNVSVLIEKHRESWIISSERSVFSKADSLRGVVLIFQDDKYYSANEVTFDGYSPLCVFP